MNKFKKYINNVNISRFRFWFQIFAFIIMVYGGFLSIDIGENLPTFSCPYIDKGGGTCFLMGLQHRFTLPIDQLISFRGLAVLTSVLFFVSWFIFFNKAWCGYICPLGTLQDWFTKLRQKIGIRYSNYSEAKFKKLKKIKYILLGLLILIPIFMANSIPFIGKLSHDWAVPFCMICPGRTVLPLFQGDASQLVIDYGSKTKMIFTVLGMAITGMFFAGAFFKKRFFCFFCPMSALQFIFKKLGFLRLIKDGTKCTKCGDCYRACDMGIREIADDIESKDIIKDDCMMCFKCVAACPEEKCLKVNFLGKTIYEATEEGFYKRQKGKK
ncbi:MAG: 4Fe-4S binding protein [Spirochaetia bacterium]|nr:4Fe-4S binding protein [Spirochaetia bacterium]